MRTFASRIRRASERGQFAARVSARAETEMRRRFDKRFETEEHFQTMVKNYRLITGLGAVDSVCSRLFNLSNT
ncbi:MAG: hypothetical protein MZV70_29330 [Desulfobacterales bacterium]|nr:hypothetical protein [Desulfobacterales bacterium]